MSVESDVKTFHLMAGQRIGVTPTVLYPGDFQRRIRLILEELSEMTTAQANGDVVEFADGLVDLVYVVVGTAVEAGIPFGACWDEVQRSNMSKRGGYLDPSGKFIKPPTYIPANIAKVLEDHNANRADPN